MLKTSSHGFGLIEAMIALLILSIGTLGIAAMQTTSIRATRVSRLNHVAALKGAEMFERIQAYRQVTDISSSSSSSSNAALQEDFQLWQESIRQLLGAQASGTVTVAPSPQLPGARFVTVRIDWVETLLGKAERSQQNQNYTLARTLVNF